jgi:hypothetical protein
VARASRLQRAYRRRAAAPHLDTSPVRRAQESAGAVSAAVPGPSDVAVDFVDMTEIVARMRAAFFADLSQG